MLVLLIALMNLPTAISTLSWQSFIGDIIPDSRRGEFFSERSRILTIVGMIVTFITGMILNLFEKSSPLPYQLLFLIAFLFGVLEVNFLLKHIEIKQTKDKLVTNVSFTKTVNLLIQHKSFVTFLICAVIFNFGWQMAWPLFSLYQINDANASAFWVSLFTVANQLSQIVTYRWWSRRAEKWGNSLMLFIAGIGMATAPIFTILSTNLLYLVFINFYSGIFVSGTVMLMFNQLLNVSPASNRTSFLASYNIIIGAIGFIAPQIGVYILDLLNMTMAMSISSVIRLFGGLAFLVVVLYVEKATNIKEYPNQYHYKR